MVCAGHGFSGRFYGLRLNRAAHQTYKGCGAGRGAGRTGDHAGDSLGQASIVLADPAEPVSPEGRISLRTIDRTAGVEPNFLRCVQGFDHCGNYAYPGRLHGNAPLRAGEGRQCGQDGDGMPFLNPLLWTPGALRGGSWSAWTSSGCEERHSVAARRLR